MHRKGSERSRKGTCGRGYLTSGVEPPDTFIAYIDGMSAPGPAGLAGAPGMAGEPLARETARHCGDFFGAQPFLSQQIGFFPGAQLDSAKTKASQPEAALHLASQSAGLAVVLSTQPMGPHGAMSPPSQSMPGISVQGGSAGFAGTAGIGPCLPVHIRTWATPALSVDCRPAAARSRMMCTGCRVLWEW